MAKENLIIAVTGTPGTGKTSFASLLAKKMPKYEVIEINDVVEKHKLFSRIDENESKVVKLRALEEKMQEMIAERRKKSNLIIVGHLVPEMKLNQDVSVVMRLNLNALIKRLEARGYKTEKIRENIISESVDYCGLKTMESCEETYEVETEGEKADVMAYLIDMASGRERKPPKKNEINRLDELLELVTNGNKYSL
jgi:adenylate kinase